jgi:hypothetical protein
MNDDNGEDFKEVCAYYGAAMYYAQVLEHGIANAMLFLDLMPRRQGKWTDEEYENYFEAHFAKTLGNLIKALRSVAALPSTLESDLLEAKDRRAYLAHHFFREASDRLHLGESHLLIDQLEQDRTFFEKTDRALESFLEPVMMRYGFNDERRAQQLQEYKNYLAEQAKGRSL